MMRYTITRDGKAIAPEFHDKATAILAAYDVLSATSADGVVVWQHERQADNTKPDRVRMLVRMVNVGSDKGVG